MPMITDVSSSSTSFTITWEQDDPFSDVVTSYELYYNFSIRECPDDINSGWSVTINDSSLRSFTVTNSTETPVEEDGVYNISLTAVNLAGSSFTQEFTYLTTPGAGEFTCSFYLLIATVLYIFSAPGGTPQNLENVSTSDTSITIQWEPVICSDHNGKIAGYNVTYYPVSEMQMFVTETVSDHVYTAMGLLIEQEYVFKVQAISRDYGSGPPASVTVTTLPLQGNR